MQDGSLVRWRSAKQRSTNTQSGEMTIALIRGLVPGSPRRGQLEGKPFVGSCVLCSQRRCRIARRRVQRRTSARSRMVETNYEPCGNSDVREKRVVCSAQLTDPQFL